MLWLRRSVIAVLAALVVVTGFSIWRINLVAERVIEAQGTAALGVDTTIDFISIGFLPLSLRIGGFEIENPDGFRERNFFTLGTGTVRVDVGSLREDTVVVPELRLHGVDVSVERDLHRTNYGIILDSLQKSDSGRDSAPPPAEGGPGKRFRIDRIVIEDVTAHLAIGLRGEFQETKIRVPEIVLADIGVAGATGVVAGELLNAIVVGILDALAHTGRMPAQLSGDLAGALAPLRRVTWDMPGDGIEPGDFPEDDGPGARSGPKERIPGRD